MSTPQEICDRFAIHAETCPGCAASLEVGTWLAHRCPTGKRMAWELTHAMLRNKKFA
jgi:hypothetical protein